MKQRGARGVKTCIEPCPQALRLVVLRVLHSAFARYQASGTNRSTTGEELQGQRETLDLKDVVGQGVSQ
jgi:hypothetical protein